MTSNNTSNVQQQPRQQQEADFTLFFHAYVAVWVIVGVTALSLNLIQVAYIVKKSLKHRSTEIGKSSIFLISLCTSDGMVGFVMVVLIVVIWILPERHIETSMHLIFLFLQGSSVVSILNLVGITIDRLWCALKPIQYRSSSRKYAIYGCASLWVIALAIIFVVVHLYRVKGFHVSVSVYLIILPSLIFSTSGLLCCCYSLIWRQLIKNRHKLEIHSSIDRDHDSNDISGTLKRQRQAAVTLREKKLTKISTLIIVTFAICWLPVAFLYILARYNYIDTEHFKLIMIIQLLATLNSVANPLLYLGTMKKRIERFCYGMRIKC